MIQLSKIIICLLSLFPLSLYSQAPRDSTWHLKGYVNELPVVQFNSVNKGWTFDNEIHNRLDFTGTVGKKLGLGLGLRNILNTGHSILKDPSYKETLFSDKGVVNMTWDIYSDRSIALFTPVDRAWISYTTGNFQVTAGRQRINWGQAIIWNPNDIFNTYSFYDFDYPERPGSDAIRIQYYSSATSSVELASKWNNKGKITLAGMGRMNLQQYDVQFLAGLVDDQDYVGGIGWSGNLKKAAFRGEISYYQPKKKFIDTTGIFLATIGSDYTFSNSMSLTFQILYNQLPNAFQPENFINLSLAPDSPKFISFTEVNIFTMVSYPFTPLFDVSLATMYFPDMKGFFLGPTLNYNFKENIDLSLIVEYFNVRFKNTGLLQNRDLNFQFLLLALRLKWSF